MSYKFTDPPPEDWKGPDGDRYILMLMRETPEWGLSRIRLAEELGAEVERLRGVVETRGRMVEGAVASAAALERIRDNVKAAEFDQTGISSRLLDGTYWAPRYAKDCGLLLHEAVTQRAIIAGNLRDSEAVLALVERLREELADARTMAHGPNRIFLTERAALLAEVERLRGVARRAYDAFSLSAQYTDQERFLAMKALGLALGLVDPDAQAEMEAKP